MDDRDGRPVRSAAGDAPPGRRLWGLALAGAVALVAFHLVLALLVEHVGVVRKVDDWVGAVAACAAAVAMLVCAGRMRAVSRRTAEAWLLLGAGYTAFGLGEVLTALGGGYGQGVLSCVLLAFYLAFYPLFLFGVLRLPKAPLSRNERLRLALDIAVVVLAAGMLLWALLIRPALAQKGMDPLKAVGAVAYPLGDLAVLWAVLSLVYSRRERTFGVYGLLAASAALLILTDTGLSIYLSGRVGALVWVDRGLGLGWTLSHVLAALAAVRQISLTGTPAPAAAPPPGPVRLTGRSFYLAYLCLAAVLAVDVLRHPGVFGPMTTAVLGLMLALVLARQVLGFRESAGLHRRLEEANATLEARVQQRTAELARANADLQAEVAERGKAEEALASSEERFRSLVQNSHDIITIHDPRGAIAYESPSAARILGYGPGGLLGKNPFELVHPDDLPILREAFERLRTRTDLGIPREYRFRHADGRWVQLESLGTNLMDAPSIRGIVMTTRDVTERRQAQDALAASEERFRSLVQNSYDIITIHDQRGVIRYESPSFSRILGYPEGALTGRNPLELVHPEDAPLVREALRRVADGTNTGLPTEFRFKRGDGSWVYLESVGSNLLSNAAVGGIVLTTREISERKQAEAQIRRKLKELTVLSAVGAIAVEASDEASLIARATAAIKGTLFPDNCGVLLVDPEAQVLRHAPSYHARDPRLSGGTIPLGRGITGSVAATGVLRRVSDAASTPDYIALDPDMRSEICVPLRVGGRVIGVIDAESRQAGAFGEGDEILLTTLASQIATSLERLRSAEAVRESEARYRAYIASSPMGVLVSDLDGRYLDVNDAACEMTGYARAELLAMSARDLLAPDGLQGAQERFRALRDGRRVSAEFQIRTKEGAKRYWSLRAAPLGAGRAIAFVMDVTERRLAEWARQESEERFRMLSEAAFEGIGITEDGRVIDANRQLAEILGCDLKDLIGREVRDFVVPEHQERVLSSIRSGSTTPYEHVARRSDGSLLHVETQGRNLPFHGRTVRVSAIRDITDRKRAEERIQLQLQRLEGLRAIDTAITSSMDLHITLSVFLEQVTRQLGVDAAAVLLLNADTQTLEYAGGRGFATKALHHTRLPMGECYAGRAAMERRLLHVEDLAVDPNGFSRSELLMSEGFHTYFAAPLVARGQVKGVFEVFHRAILKPDEEWTNYLQTLAGQAAIALDNMSLFQNLQRTNVELGLAYETTLEGWSRALELRDRETQGHTMRVTDLTLRLARAVGMEEQAMTHVRRGALLHDIGKMGIPDSILLKPGPLTEQEWVVMRRHTEFALTLLWPVAYLRPALDIPYCHHERWDGSGYPRGLKGEEIPLAARVFAVVDNWDALSYDRPYRAAWPKERVRAYLREKAGVLFDPAVVGEFLKITGQGG